MKASTLFRESLLIYLLVFLLVLGLALLALGVSFIQANLYALVAVVFIGVPHILLSRKSLDGEDFALSTKQWPKHVAIGLLATFITLIPFAIGQYVWETQVRENKVAFSLENYAHWPLEMDGQPVPWGKKPGVWIWGRKGNLYIGLRGSPKQQNKLHLKGSTPFMPVQMGGILMRPLTKEGTQIKGQLKAAKNWELIPKWHHRPVTMVIQPIHSKHSAPKRLTITQKPIKKGTTPWTMHKGPGAEEIKAPTMDLKRGYWWMFLWAITQLFFIALPEEYFYRGYLQTRLSQAFKAHGKHTWTFMGMTPAIVLTSILFGLGHLLIPVQGVLLATRFSVFFPSLLFGWLRQKTGSIIAPTVYHAGCNLMVLFLGTHYL